MSQEFDGRILAQVAELGLPRNDEFILTDSSALAEWGVIPFDEVGDIDGVTTRENIDYLRRKIGWKIIERTVGYKQDGRRVRVTAVGDEAKVFDIHPHGFSMYDYNRTGNGRIQPFDLIEFSTQDPATGLWVARIDYIDRTKRETGRAKDELRRLAIREYLQKRL